VKLRKIEMPAPGDGQVREHLFNFAANLANKVWPDFGFSITMLVSKHPGDFTKRYYY
jgi:hypothetical protein